MANKKHTDTTENENQKKSLDVVMRQINKAYGNKVIAKASDIKEKLVVQYYKTPSYVLNDALQGGLGVGRIVEFFGNDSAGKTCLAEEIIGLRMKEDKKFKAAWIETEGSINIEELNMFGIDLDRFIIVQQSDELPADDCMEIIRGLVNSGQFGIIVLNSVAALAPRTEIEDNIDKQNVALSARILSKFLRLTCSQLAKYKCTLIFINQLRAKIDFFGGNTTTGGKAIPYYCTQRIEMMRKKLDNSDPISPDEGMRVNCYIRKNRLARSNPLKECHYYVTYNKGINSNLEIFQKLFENNIIKQKGAWIKFEDSSGNILKVPSDKGEIEGKWNGKKVFGDFLKKDKKGLEFFKKLLQDEDESIDEQNNINQDFENEDTYTLNDEENTSENSY